MKKENNENKLKNSKKGKQEKIDIEIKTEKITIRLTTMTLCGTHLFLESSGDWEKCINCCLWPPCIFTGLEDETIFLCEKCLDKI